MRRATPSAGRRHRTPQFGKPACDAAHVRDRVGRWGEVQDVAGGCRLRMQADDLAWAVFALANLDADFEIESPAGLVERTAEVGARFVRATAHA